MYYEIHVFHNRQNSFSIPFETSTHDENEIIEDAITKGILSSEDANAVDYVELISEHEYKNMKNI
jgi:hypothetical protein